MVDLFIDCGHGGNDSGAVGNGLQEKNITLSVGLKAAKAAKRCGISVMLSRETDKTMSLSERTNKANKEGAKCLVSVHVNSAENSAAKGVETFGYNSKTTNLAKCVQDELVKVSNNGNRGVKTANFHMLRESKMRACLTELAFISNVDDAKLLRSNEDAWAEAIVKGVCKYLGKTYVAPNTSTPSGDNQLYRICVTAVTGAKNADAEVEKLIKQGFKDAYKMPVNK